MTLTLRKTIPSHSHNAPFNTELGSHWPEGQKFRLLSKARSRSLRQNFMLPYKCILLEQVGGEEVIITVPPEKMPEWFGVEV
jgi:hypothetical protein